MQNDDYRWKPGRFNGAAKNGKKRLAADERR
jgi:hypothetical protein